jgi:hypothetical protein
VEGPPHAVISTHKMLTVTKRIETAPN